MHKHIDQASVWTRSPVSIVYITGRITRSAAAIATAGDDDGARAGAIMKIHSVEIQLKKTEQTNGNVLGKLEPR